MKNYLLTVIGVFGKDSQKVCKEIAKSLQPLVDSPDLRFIYGNEALIYYFASEVNKDELFLFVDAILLDITKTFILTEVKDNFTISLTRDSSQHLMNFNTPVLDENTGSLDNNEFKKLIENENYEEFDDWFDDEDEDIIKKLKKPSLNQILDKISETGLNSLTLYEKEILKNYSKI